MNPVVANIVDRLHVSASERSVIRAVRSRMRAKYRRALSHREARKEAYKDALKLHAANRHEYLTIMRGV